MLLGPRRFASINAILKKTRRLNDDSSRLWLMNRRLTRVLIFFADLKKNMKCIMDFVLATRRLSRQSISRLVILLTDFCRIKRLMLLMRRQQNGDLNRRAYLRILKSFPDRLLISKLNDERFLKKTLRRARNDLKKLPRNLGYFRRAMTSLARSGKLKKQFLRNFRIFADTLKNFGVRQRQSNEQETLSVWRRFFMANFLKPKKSLRHLRRSISHLRNPRQKNLTRLRSDLLKIWLTRKTSLRLLPDGPGFLLQICLNQKPRNLPGLKKFLKSVLSVKKRRFRRLRTRFGEHGRD